jgi:hypothetical protein
MVMLSLIMKKEYLSELVYSFLVDASHKILKTENIYKAFYKEEDFSKNDIGIDIAYEATKKILLDCLSGLISRLKSKF